MKFSQGLLAALHNLESAISIAAYLIIAALLMTDVVLRELFSSSIAGTQRIAVFFMIATGFLGMGLAADYGRYLRPQFADGLIPKAYSSFASRIGSMVMAMTFFYFSWLGGGFVKSSWEFGELARSVNFPLWMVQLVVPYAFFSVGIRYLVYSIWPELKPEQTDVQ